MLIFEHIHLNKRIQRKETPHLPSVLYGTCTSFQECQQCQYVHVHVLKIFNVKYHLFLIWLGLNVTLTHQNRSYRDSETTENVETQKRKQRGGNDTKRTATTKNKHN